MYELGSPVSPALQIISLLLLWELFVEKIHVYVCAYTAVVCMYVYACAYMSTYMHTYMEKDSTDYHPGQEREQ